MYPLKCNKCKADLECMAGRSAHPSNWYCPKCDVDEKLEQKNTPTFTKQPRYLVLKYTDINLYLSQHKQKQLLDLVTQITDGRAADNRIPFECVVVESDWPEYDQTWEAIADRVREEELNESAPTTN